MGLPSGPAPTHASKPPVRLKLSAREDDAVRLPRHEAFPHLLRGGGNIEDIFQWCLMGHDCSRFSCAILYPQAKTPHAKSAYGHPAYWARATASLLAKLFISSAVRQVVVR